MPEKYTLLQIIVLINLSVSYCWIFTDINYKKIVEGIPDIELLRVDLEADGLELAKFSLIFPGTKWCGPGNVADNYDDLGPSKDTDRCCRDHDFCPEVIEGLETKYNLTNAAVFTRLHCNCDEVFRLCLRNVSSTTSSIVGNMYFNAIGTKCFREDYPATGCVQKGGWLKNKCLKYSYNTTSQKIYQWFDVPPY